jgi:TM2 domain-containing membrane protein YozV
LNESLEFLRGLRRCAMKPYESQKTDKNPATAAILSFLFIGLGQAYNGEIAKAVVFLSLYAISILLTIFLIGFVTIPLLWIWSIVDAYRSSQRMNQVVTARQSPSNTSAAGLVTNAHVSG